MTQATKEMTKVFVVAVKELGKDMNGFKATCDISGLGKFPIDLNRIPEADYKLLEVGKTYNVVLERGNLKEHEPAYDGKKDWMFFWNWRGFAPTVVEGTFRNVGEEEATEARDPTQDSIERQKALDIAERLYWNWFDRVGNKLPDSPSLMAEHLKRVKSVAAGLVHFLATGKAADDTPKQ